MGGVLLPSSAAKKSTAGTVVALGEATAVKVGVQQADGQEVWECSAHLRLCPAVTRMPGA